MKIDKMVEQTNQSENNLVKGERQNGGKTGQRHIEDVSYDKDVVEIKLPDTVLLSDYDGHFVKDVCIDEGVLVDQKTSTEKLVDQKVSSNVDSSMRDTNGDIREEIRAEATKSPHERKSQIVILPVVCATDGTTEEQYSSCKADIEGNDTEVIFSDLNSANLSPKQLGCHEGPKGFQQVAMVISESCENQEPFLTGEATHKVSSNDCHETGIGVAPVTSNMVHSDFPAESTSDKFSPVMPEEVVVSAESEGGSNQLNHHYNPFIAYGSLGDTWEPNSVPIIMDAASVAPICPVEKTDSFSDLVNRALGGFDSVEIAEAIIEESISDYIESNSSTLDVQASEEISGEREGLTDEMRTEVTNETGTATSLSTSNAEPSDAKSEGPLESDFDTAQNVHDFNPRDVVVGTKRSEDNTDSKNSTLEPTEPVVQQNGPDSAKLTAQNGLRNPFESSFSGPSITSGPQTPSGHIPYSGNISLRSESSTTSTRSFAFPVLQNEWNSSPVKMAKADRRRLRQDRGWSYRILCCKF